MLIIFDPQTLLKSFFDSASLSFGSFFALAIFGISLNPKLTEANRLAIANRIDCLFETLF